MCWAYLVDPRAGLSIVHQSYLLLTTNKKFPSFIIFPGTTIIFSLLLIDSVGDSEHSPRLKMYKISVSFRNPSGCWSCRSSQILSYLLLPINSILRYILPILIFIQINKSYLLRNSLIY